ncbi:MAG TPA: 50S ribosomal protein L15 [Chloroflexi bacterium]|jgi:large subunit ribosomal protein L15|nr:50S ribosomal protein L15 [Chloroflexota bacterium]
MKLHDLREPEGARRNRKRRGRGIAAGQGKTGGFGTKGSGARSGRGGRRYFEGGQLPLVNRLPIKRGFRNVNRIEYAVVNVEALNRFEAGSVVDLSALINSGLVRREDRLVKILGEGNVDRPLTVIADRFSESAKAKIEAAGGTAQEL